MIRAALALAGIVTAAAAAWHKRRALGFDEAIEAELEDLAGMKPLAGDLTLMTFEPNVAAFLRMIRHGEGTAGADGYRTMFGGELVAQLADHPRRKVTRLLGGRMLTSSAAGAYQFLESTWDECAAALELRDFSPTSQDAAALYLIRRRGALADVRAGRVDEAIQKCAKEWASLPGSPYGQPTVALSIARNVYAAAGGRFA